jgi:septal ring factor EnvC (AmiA/AmiB activator)
VVRRVFGLVECPRCGVEVADPVKAWLMTQRPSRSGEMWQLKMGLYECLNCKKKFRRIVGRKKITIKGLVQDTKMLEEMVMEAVKKKAELEERVKALEEEKTSLLTEIEALKAIPELEAKVSALEAEVAKLKEEKKALEEKITPPPCEAAPPETLAPAEEKPSE